MTAQIDTSIRAILSDQSAGLIRAEIHALERRTALERAIVEAVSKLGCSIDEVSEATGIIPDEIRSLLDRPQDVDEDLGILAGIG